MNARTLNGRAEPREGLGAQRQRAFEAKRALDLLGRDKNH
jgi:hypothetical protein